MPKCLAILLLSALVATGASGQAVQDADTCVEVAHALAHAAEAKSLDADQIDRIEDLVNKMEEMCDADKVAEAMAVAKDIEAEINAQ